MRSLTGDNADLVPTEIERLKIGQLPNLRRQLSQPHPRQIQLLPLFRLRLLNLLECRLGSSSAPPRCVCFILPQERRIGNEELRIEN